MPRPRSGWRPPAAELPLGFGMLPTECWSQAHTHVFRRLPCRVLSPVGLSSQADRHFPPRYAPRGETPENSLDYSYITGYDTCQGTVCRLQFV